LLLLDSFKFLTTSNSLFKNQVSIKREFVRLDHFSGGRHKSGWTDLKRKWPSIFYLREHQKIRISFLNHISKCNTTFSLPSAFHILSSKCNLQNLLSNIAFSLIYYFFSSNSFCIIFNLFSIMFKSPFLIWIFLAQIN